MIKTFVYRRYIFFINASFIHAFQVEDAGDANNVVAQFRQ